MTSRGNLDSAFQGSIPGIYDRYLGPLLFSPYATEMARRAAELKPQRILETAAGTGIVTSALHRACPDAEIIVTDLNPGMLDIAAQRVRTGLVHFQAADAQDLPCDDGEFDLVVCQFGVMFYPDRIRGNHEARRVLIEGGTYLVAIWDSIEANPAARIVHEAVGDLFPDDPPNFLARTPYGYHDITEIRADLADAGFEEVTIDTVALDSLPVSALGAATGLVSGSPLRGEIEERDPGGLDRAVEAAAAALRQIEKDGALVSTLSAHIVTATRE